MIQKIIFWIVILTLLASGDANACEPMIPLALIFTNGLMASGSFVLLICVVLFKATIFAVSEKLLKPYIAFIFMLVANVFSTIIGLCLAFSAASPTLLLFFIPVVFGVSLLPAKRLIQKNPWGYFGKWNHRWTAAAVTGLYMVTFFLFGMAMVILDKSLVAFWALKFLYIYVALIISIGLTTLWEEWAVSRLAKKQMPEASFLPAALKANIGALLVGMGYAAIKIMPERLHSSGTLTYVLQFFGIS